MTDSETTYLNSINKLFKQYKTIAEKAIEQLSDQEINFMPDKESNSIALIVKHLSGNMISRWTDFYTSDGEKEWRNRDTEFEGKIENKKQLLDTWEKGWSCLFAIIEKMQPDDLLKTVYIRKEAHTVIDAVNRQVAHYSYHVGQIVYLAKHIRSKDWKSLSIPKGESKKFTPL